MESIEVEIDKDDKSLKDKRYKSSPFVTVFLRFLGPTEEEGNDSIYGKNS